MPTYTCWSEPGLVPPEVRGDIVKVLTETHHEVAVAPRYLVQVIFNEVAAGSHFVAGQPVDARLIWIRADIRAGRTVEQKRELLERIARDVGALLGIAADSVWVYLCDIPGSNIFEHGRVLPEPGQEETWFAQLPPDQRERLARLA